MCAAWKSACGVVAKGSQDERHGYAFSFLFLFFFSFDGR
jgi:hypothetical protein